jgi:hypothetical protein
MVTASTSSSTGTTKQQLHAISPQGPSHSTPSHPPEANDLGSSPAVNNTLSIPSAIADDVRPTRVARSPFVRLHSTLLFCWPLCVVLLASEFTERPSNRRHYSTHDLRRPEYQEPAGARFRRQTSATCRGETECVGTSNKNQRVMRSREINKTLLCHCWPQGLHCGLVYSFGLLK